MYIRTHAESFNAGDWINIEEATGTSYTERKSGVAKRLIWEMLV